MSSGRVISNEEARKLSRAEFPVFDRRPVNYFRDQFADEETISPLPENAKDADAQVARAVTAERERMEREHQAALLEKFNEGCKQGRREAADELTRGLELLTEYANVLQAEKSEVASRAEAHSLELAFALAKKIIGDELQTRPEAIQAVVGKALQQALGCDKIKLRVHPDDLSYLEAVQSDWRARLSGDVEFSVRADESVERGGCLIETEQGTLDAQISSQLATLHSGLAASSASES